MWVIDIFHTILYSKVNNICLSLQQGVMIPEMKTKCYDIYFEKKSTCNSKHPCN